MKFILGKKIGMSQVFKDDKVIPVTIIEAGPCYVTQIKTVDKDKYEAIQIGFGQKKKINKPLTGTSANISGQPTSHKIEEVLQQFKNQKYQPDLIVDAGNLPKSKPSKVIDLTGKKLKILRS